MVGIVGIEVQGLNKKIKTDFPGKSPFFESPITLF